jgi:hypothetical protein
MLPRICWRQSAMAPTSFMSCQRSHKFKIIIFHPILYSPSWYYYCCCQQTRTHAQCSTRCLLLILVVWPEGFRNSNLLAPGNWLTGTALVMVGNFAVAVVKPLAMSLFDPIAQGYPTSKCQMALLLPVLSAAQFVSPRLAALLVYFQTIFAKILGRCENTGIGSSRIERKIQSSERFDKPKRSSAIYNDSQDNSNDSQDNKGDDRILRVMHSTRHDWYLSCTVNDMIGN